MNHHCVTLSNLSQSHVVKFAKRIRKEAIIKWEIGCALKFVLNTKFLSLSFSFLIILVPSNQSFFLS